MANIWFLTAVTMERAWVVFCITKGKQHRITKAKIMMVVVAVWIAAWAASMAPLLGWNRYIYEVRRKYFFSILLLLHFVRVTCTPAQWTT
jgi:hypothetical protein